MFHDVGPEFVRDKLGRPEYQIIDVRTPEEYIRYHIPSSLLVPLPYIFELIDLLDQKKLPIVVCEHGARSSRVCYELGLTHNLGYNMIGGMNEWMRRGYIYETGIDELGMRWAKFLKERGIIK
jgi:rhodanese-related sulfurtransferase